ncbi:TIGR02453 family protein [Flavobacterium haoranii]|uniref:TIGR02453 family protein n=2 Tax=Flavobacterium haoranii TaxID=683124 RepID=A0A1M6HUN6_9FLAO|nr:TIGR02453 family protein [Flavobacterium haoranii]
MITQDIFDFLKNLKENNNKDWFTINKPTFENVQKKAKEFFNEIGFELGKVDSIEKVNVFRIYRDVRFSKDKTPYKSHFSADYRRTKPMLRGGYYLHIENNNSFIGGGFWDPNKEDLLRIRKELEIDASEFREIINSQVFKNFFGELKGEELVTAPKGFDKTHPDIDLIKKKQYLVMRSFTNKEVLSKDFPKEILATFAAMRPFFDYMSAVLTTDLNGESLY